MSMPFANACTTPRLLFAALACALGMSTATAQDKAPALPMAEADSHLLPVWNARSGRLEAVLLLDRKQEQPGTLDWLFPTDKDRAAGIGLQSSLNSGSRLGGALTLDSHSSSLALLCNQGIHMAISLGQGQQCLLAQVAAPGDPLLNQGGSPVAANLGAGWQSASGLFDLNFGLSWLSAPLADLAPTALSHSALDWARPFSTAQGELQIRNLSLGGSLNLPGQRWLSLDAALGTQDMVTLSGGPKHWDSAAVTLGVGMRGLSGRLTGRLLELPQGGNWSGLDLGFSWRTPWQGVLSFGADNLLDTKAPDSSRWPLQELPPLDSPSGRVPYVRYKQDL